MTPLFFHTAAQPLFGHYGPPTSHQDRDTGVLLCAPVGHEYMRTHWCLRLLAAELQRAGFHVFRFDHSFHGDSWGQFEEAAIDRWLADIQAAFQELVDNSGVRQVAAVGLRLGATLACAAGREIPLQHLILWDPVLDGRKYVENMRRMQGRLKTDWPSAPTCTPGAAFEDLLGYHYPAQLIEQLNALNLSVEALPKVERLSLVLTTDELAAHDFSELREKSGFPTQLRVSKEAVDWDQAASFAEPVLMAEARRIIVDLLGATAS